MVTTWTRQHDKHEAMRLLGAAGIPAGAVLDTKELPRTRPSTSAASCRRWSTPTVKDYAMPAWPVRHDGSAADRQAASPLLGEHTAEVLASGSGSARARSRAWRARRW